MGSLEAIFWSSAVRDLDAAQDHVRALHDVLFPVRRRIRLEGTDCSAL